MAAGSTTGTLFRVTTWGESHGPAIGVVIDGCPAGLRLSEEDIEPFLKRRKPGQSRFTTGRQETDRIMILSGVFEGRTTGTPISMMVINEDQKPKDYSIVKDTYRPGHADYTYDLKYGFRDYRGGGRSSARETIARVAAGAVASKILGELGVTVTAYTRSIGPVEVSPDQFDLAEAGRNELYMPDPLAYQMASAYLNDVMADGDSAGGVVECVIRGIPAGVGEPVFQKLDAELSSAVFSIGAVKGFEMGEGFAASRLMGSENNDEFCLNDYGSVRKKTNHAGGVLGGISDGSDLVFRAAFKPTPTIGKVQDTVNNMGEEIGLQVKGRHDPVVVPRAVVVVESMAAITILDQLLLSMTSRMDRIRTFFGHDEYNIDEI